MTLFTLYREHREKEGYRAFSEMPGAELWLSEEELLNTSPEKTYLPPAKKHSPVGAGPASKPHKSRA